MISNRKRTVALSAVAVAGIVTVFAIAPIVADMQANAFPFGGGFGFRHFGFGHGFFGHGFGFHRFGFGGPFFGGFGGFGGPWGGWGGWGGGCGCGCC